MRGQRSGNGSGNILALERARWPPINVAMCCFTGDNMNVFLNENWKEVANELGPSLADAIGEVISLIIAQIVDVVPYENIFLQD